MRCGQGRLRETRVMEVRDMLVRGRGRGDMFVFH